MSRKSDASGNQGIIADTVSAQVMAVGTNATAIQSLSSGELAQFRASLQELKTTIEGIGLPEQAKASISEHVKGLEAEAAKANPDRGRVEGALRSLASSAKLLGEFVSNAGTVLAPIAKIAAIFGFSIL
ncbi:hypothetical protein [Bradyrhizobium sp. RT6a]|uniref:hypothetical protein n=1 Tax=unclassified Bradyrhizobium TaxID=2631580 RepID=UPI003398705C